MPAAIIQIDQVRPSGTSFGTPGIAREDLWNVRQLNLTSTNAAGSYSWTVDLPEGSSATITNPASQVAHLIPDVPGPYRFTLQVNGGGGPNTQSLIARVRFDTNGLSVDFGLSPPALLEGESGVGESNHGGNARGWDMTVRRYFDAPVPHVDTVAVLRNTVAYRQTKCLVTSYSALGDGGGGEFYWDVASTLLDDGGTTFTPTGVAVGRWRRRINGYVDPRWFGAKADGESVTGIVTTAGSNVVVKAGRTAADIGKLIAIEGAATGPVRHVTTITNVVGTTITLNVAPTRNSAGTRVTVLNDFQIFVFADIATTATVPTVTISGLTGADIGKTIILDEVGTGPVTLQTTITNVAGNNITLASAGAATTASITTAAHIGTNSDAALAAALVYAGTSDLAAGKVEFQDGIYSFLTTLLPQKGLTIKGNGSGTTLRYFGTTSAIQCRDNSGLLLSGSNHLYSFRLESANSQSKYAIENNELYDCTYEHLAIWGNAQDGVFSQGFRIAGFRITATLTFAVNSANLWISRNVVHGSEGSGLIDETTPGAAGNGIINVVGNRFQGNTRWGIESPHNGNQDLNIWGNDLEGNIMGGIMLEQVHNSQIRYNHFELTSKYAIQIGKTGFTCGSFTIANNFIGMTGAAFPSQYGIAMVGGTGVFGFSVEDNKIICTGANGKSAVRFTAGVGNARIVGNEVSGFTPDTATVPLATVTLEDYAGTGGWVVQEDQYVHQQTSGAGQTMFDGHRFENGGTATAILNQYTPGMSWLSYGWKTAATAGQQLTESRIHHRSFKGVTHPWARWVVMHRVNNFGDETKWIDAFEVWGDGTAGASNLALGPTGDDDTVFGGAHNIVWIPDATTPPNTVFPYFPSKGAGIYGASNTGQGLRSVTKNGYTETLVPMLATAPAQGGPDRKKWLCKPVIIINDATPDSTTLDFGGTGVGGAVASADIGPARTVGEIDVLIVAQITTGTSLSAKWRRKVPFRLNSAGAMAILGGTPETIGTDQDAIGVGAPPTLAITGGATDNFTITVSGKAGINVMYECWLDVPCINVA